MGALEVELILFSDLPNLEKKMLKSNVVVLVVVGVSISKVAKDDELKRDQNYFTELDDQLPRCLKIEHFK